MHQGSHPRHLEVRGGELYDCVRGAAQESLITSVVFLGTMVGANMWGALSDARGRRVGFQACSVSVFLFGLLSAGAPNYGVTVPCSLPSGNGRKADKAKVQAGSRDHLAGALNHALLQPASGPFCTSHWHLLQSRK